MDEKLEMLLRDLLGEMRTQNELLRTIADELTSGVVDIENATEKAADQIIESIGYLNPR